jgi:hypothetical protein
MNPLDGVRWERSNATAQVSCARDARFRAPTISSTPQVRKSAESSLWMVTQDSSSLTLRPPSPPGRPTAWPPPLHGRQFPLRLDIDKFELATWKSDEQQCSVGVRPTGTNHRRSCPVSRQSRSADHVRRSRELRVFCFGGG